MSVWLYAFGGHEGEQKRFFRAGFLNKGCQSVVERIFIGLVNLVFPFGILHFADVDGFVLSVDEQVDLAVFLR